MSTRYQNVTLAAYQPAPSAVLDSSGYQMLSFPTPWREAIEDFVGKRRSSTGKHEPAPNRPFVLPVAALNDIIQTVLPDCIHTLPKSLRDSQAPWLYTRDAPEDRTLRSLVRAWLMGLCEGRRPELVNTAMQRIQTANPLSWHPVFFDPLRTELTPSGTGLPGEHTYTLLPDLLARRLIAHPYIGPDGRSLEFRAVPTSQGAELVSWPPFDPCNGASRMAFSFLIRLTVQTVPFTAAFRVHVHLGTRRWMNSSRPLRLPWGRKATVCLETTSHWLKVRKSRPERLSLGRIRQTRKGVHWIPGDSVNVLDHLPLQKALPSPEELFEESHRWLRGQNGVTAAILHRNDWGTHQTGTGLSAGDRVPLLRWIDEVFAPELVRVPNLPRSGTVNKPRNPRQPSPGKKDEKKILRAKEKLQQQLTDRRRRLAQLLEGRPFEAEIVWQTEETRDALLRALCEYLGLDGDGGPSSQEREWHTEELTIRVYLYTPEEGVLGRLGLSTTAKHPSRQTIVNAVTDRRRLMDRFFSTKSSAPPTGGIRLAVIELGGRKLHGQTADPKWALRLGSADAGRLTQFIELFSEANRESLSERAKSSWHDGFRQMGISVIPEHNTGGALPGDIDYVGVHVIKRRSDGPTRQSLILPIAIRLRPKASGCRITGWVADQRRWIPYPDYLVWMTKQNASIEDVVTSMTGDLAEGSASSDGPVAGGNGGVLERRRSETARFLRGLLYQLRDRPTIVMVHAQNMRLLWPWLQNSRVDKDRIELGNSPAQPIDLYGPSLYLVSVRDSQRDETPQWYGTKKPHGFPHGLFLMVPDAEEHRVFASIQEKSMDTRDFRSSRFPGITKSGLLSSKDRHLKNPRVLEISVLGCPSLSTSGTEAGMGVPTAVAACIHQLREVADYRDPLAFPLPLHLAKRVQEYALPTDTAVDSRDSEDFLAGAAGPEKPAESDPPVQSSA